MRIISMLVIPFLGTVLGSALVFFVKERINTSFEKIMNGIAAGIMLAASVWSLLIPAIEMQNNGSVFSSFSVAAGFLSGIIILMLLGKTVLKLPSVQKLGKNFAKTALLIFAVTIHNLPEGMASGVTFAGSDFITQGGAAALSVGLAIQNFPEGAIVSLPLKNAGVSKLKSFFCGVLSGIVEPLGALITVYVALKITAVLPLLFSFAAGAMFYVVVDELIPCSDGNETTTVTVSTALGFVLMMILDIAL